MTDYKKFNKLVPYRLNGSILNAIKYKCSIERNGQISEETLQYNDLLNEIDGLGHFEFEQFLSFKITAAQTVIEITCHGFESDLLRITLDLLHKKRHCVSVTWYFFDKSRACDEPHFLYHFFVTYRDEILLDDSIISESYDAKIPENLFIEPNEEEIWADDTAKRIAFSKLMYRKFYAETLTGKLMKICEEENQRSMGEVVFAAPTELQSLTNEVQKIRKMFGWTL